VSDATGRRRRSVIVVAIIAAVGILFFALVWLTTGGDSAAQRAVQRLRPGQSHNEALQILEGVDYTDTVSKGSGLVVFNADGEDVWLVILSDQVVKIHRIAETGSPWERMGRALERRALALIHRFG
jgi:hypothetical protein